MPCTNCMAKYSLIKREHGCPSCGFGFCAKCINKKTIVKRISDKPLAVCDKCFAKINGKVEDGLEDVNFEECPPASFKDLYKQKGQKKLILKKNSVEQPSNSTRIDEQDLIERLARLKEKDVDEIRNPMKMVVDSDEGHNRPSVKPKAHPETAEDLIRKTLDDPSVKNKDFDRQQNDYEIGKLEERLANLRNVPVEEIRKPRTIVSNDVDRSDSEAELGDDAKELIALAEKSLRKKEPDLFVYENEALDSDIEDAKERLCKSYIANSTSTGTLLVNIYSMSAKQRSSPAKVKSPPKKYDNPYRNRNGDELDQFRQRMKNIVDLYFYMTFPDTQGSVRRPKHQPFRMNNLSYIRDCVPRGQRLHQHKDKSHSDSPFNALPLTHFTPSVVFLRIKNDQMVDSKRAFVHCFQVREVDGEYSTTQSIPGSGFEASLSSDLRVNIDLLGMKPLKMEESSVKNEYLVVKVKFTVDTVNVSGGRRLRSVPARLHAHLEDKSNDGESRIMFAVKKVSTMLRQWDGHKVRQGKMVLALIPQEKLGLDGDSVDWQTDKTLVPRVLAEAKKPTQHPIITINIHVDPKGDALSESDEDEEEECSEDDSTKPTTSRNNRKVVEAKEELFTAKQTPKSAVWVHEKAPGTTIGTPFGLLDIVEDNLRSKWLNAPMPDVIGWCFRMTDGPYGQETRMFSNSVEEVIAAAESAPPADVFRFTNSECFLCQHKRKFTYFTSFLYHLSTFHSRLSFKFKENLVQSPVNASPKKKRKSESGDDWCHGLIVSLNHKFDGSHEFDITRHYRKYNNNNSAGRLRKITDAWKQPPCFIITKSLAKMLRQTPPGTSVESVLFNSKFNDGNFGENQKIIDLHFQTARYSQAHQPYTIQNQHRRVREFVDLNDNEKELLILLNDFFSSFRCLHSPRMTYSIHRVMVKELREKLLEARYYFQFIIHLCNLKKSGRIHEAEWYDLTVRLKEGPSYDPRKDSKHCVYSMLTHLEEQRAQCDGIGRRRRLESPPRRSCDIRDDVIRESTEPPRLALDRLKLECKTQSEPPKSPPIVAAVKNLKRKSIETPEEVLVNDKVKLEDGQDSSLALSKENEVFVTNQLPCRSNCNGMNSKRGTVNVLGVEDDIAHKRSRFDQLTHAHNNNEADSNKSASSDNPNKSVPVARVSPFGTEKIGEESLCDQKKNGDTRGESEGHSKGTDESQVEDDCSQTATSEKNRDDEERTQRTFRNTEQRTANSNVIRRTQRKDQPVVRKEATQPLPPHDISLKSYEELEKRYPFVHQRRLKIIWHFMKEWSRNVIDWQ